MTVHMKNSIIKTLTMVYTTNMLTKIKEVTKMVKMKMRRRKVRKRKLTPKKLKSPRQGRRSCKESCRRHRLLLSA